MDQKTHGIVLHALKYGDNSLIVKIFTRDFGLKSFMVRGFRGKKSGLSPSLFLPLTILNLDLKNSKSNGAFSSIKDAQCIQPLHLIRNDFGKQAMSLFMAEVLYKTIPDEEAHPDLYTFIEDNLMYLNSAFDLPAVFAHYFLVNYSRYLGLYPNIYSEDNNTFFDLRDGIFGADKNLHADFLLEEESLALKQILNTGIENLQEIKMAKTLRNSLLNGLLHYYRIHLLNFREIKSHIVLAEVMRG